jgi:hypothetical protein
MPYRVALLWTEEPRSPETGEGQICQGELVEEFSTWDAADVAGDLWKTSRLLDDRHSGPYYEVHEVDAPQH